MATYTFGAGSLWGVRTDVSAPTPRKFGTLQNVSVDFSANTKELFGQFQMPVAAARGMTKITGKAKVGQIMGSVFNDLFFGGTMTAGNTELVSLSEIGTVAATIDTVVVTNHSSLVEDLGVSYQATGLPFTNTGTASPSVAGTYKQSGGTYTFNTADVGSIVAIDYTYSNTSSTGETLSLTNQIMGVQPVFAIVLNERWQSPTGLKQVTLKLNACISGKLAIATKQEDFEMPELDFSAFADGSNNILTWNFQDVV